jgi:hypothetical protein
MTKQKFVKVPKDWKWKPLSDDKSENMKDCPKCKRLAMQTQWWTGKKYCPICDSEKV